MKVVLISMPDVAAVMMHEAAFHLPNLGIASLGANLDEDHEVSLIDLVRKRRSVRQYLQRTLLTLRPDVVGLSSMTWQFGTCLKIVRLVRRWLPQAKIVVGGYHATLMYDEIGRDPGARDIDFLVRGEGEEAFRRLVNALAGRDEIAAIPSLSHRGADGGLLHNPQGELLDLSRLRLPIRDKRRLTRGYHRINRSVEVIETSRGCTRSCNFCSIRHMYGQSFRPFPTERVLADIDDIYHQRRCRRIFVSDDNMVLSPPAGHRAVPTPSSAAATAACTSTSRPTASPSRATRRWWPRWPGRASRASSWGSRARPARTWWPPGRGTSATPPARPWSSATSTASW